MTRLFKLLSAVIPILLQGAAAYAQDYPAKPIRFIAGYAPGGSTDTVARIVGKALSESIGQQVIVDNRTGAGGTIAADMVAKSAPDGYNVLVGDIGPNAIAATLYTKLPYDAYKSFEHVTLMVTFPLAVVVPAASRITSLQQLIDEARAKPATLTYGSQGVGAPAHLFAELINLMAKVKTVHVPYKGGAPALAGLLAQEVDFAVIAVSTAQANLAAGKIRALAVTSAAPSPRLPGIPPIATVLPGYDAVNFHSLHVAAHTPQAIVEKLQRATVAALHRPEVKSRLDDLSIDVKATTSAECAAFIRKEIDKWGAVVKATGARVD
jgi:tripartite-type tricarboxylate transporter receptor subunit TctC